MFLFLGLCGPPYTQLESYHYNCYGSQFLFNLQPFLWLYSVAYCQEWVSDPTKVQIGQGQYRIDVAKDHQKQALKEGCCEREWIWMDVSATEKTCYVP